MNCPRCHSNTVVKNGIRPVVAGKDSGLIHHIERFNNTLRHWVSRLVRQSLAFSKKLDNHIGAIWLFVQHYNSSRLDFS
jgi:IS1 family transposase